VHGGKVPWILLVGISATGIVSLDRGLVGPHNYKNFMKKEKFLIYRGDEMSWLRIVGYNF
jgi:hypothetical protein